MYKKNDNITPEWQVLTY